MKNKLLSIVAIALLAGPVAANAVIITISDQGSASGQWDVTTVSGTAAALAGTLGNQIWYGNGALAGVFVHTIGGNLGFPNTFSNEARGPIFAFDSSHGFWAYSGGTSLVGFSSDRTWEWAVASRVTSVPEPGALALLGLGFAGLVLTRRRRIFATNRGARSCVR